MLNPADIDRAAALLTERRALLVCAGAGMGVDSGLPDFRGENGFWNAYPVFKARRLHFSDIAQPHWFYSDPGQAWGFYGHRLNLYRQTQPHAGFEILRRWAMKMPLGYGVYTSNVDGHFQRAGFSPERVAEVHGSIEYMQCSVRCGPIFAADAAEIRVDPATLRAAEPLPKCPRCGTLARPNILMFNDMEWDAERTSAQGRRVESWVRELPKDATVVVECGAGKAIPTIRFLTQQLIQTKGAKVIRINPRDEDLMFPDDGVSIKSGALEALAALDARLQANDIAS